MKVSHARVKMSHSQVGRYVKTHIAMSHLTCWGEIFPWSCHKVTYSSIKVTELCPNDIITLIDGSGGVLLNTTIMISTLNAHCKMHRWSILRTESNDSRYFTRGHHSWWSNNLDYISYVLIWALIHHVQVYPGRQQPCIKPIRQKCRHLKHTCSPRWQTTYRTKSTLGNQP